MSGEEIVDIRRVIDEGRFSRFQARVVGLCILLQMCDGIDLQAIGYTGPGIREELHLTLGQMGPIFSAGLLGMTCGALLVGPISDRVGRRAVMIGAVLLFGAFSLAIAWATDVTQIIVLRFLAGLGFGGAMPNSLAMVAEYMPHRKRYAIMGVSSLGFIGGSALSGWITLALMPHFGWRSVFVAGGGAALVMALALIAFLPESLRFLASRGDRDSEMRGIVGKLAPTLALMPGTRFTAPDRSPRGLPVRQLFTEGRTVITLPFWIAAFFVLLNLYLLTNWIPILTKQQGLPTEQGVFIASLFQVGAGFAGISVGFLMDRVIPFRVLAIFAACAGAAVISLGLAGPHPPLLMMITFITGFFTVGCQSCLNMSSATMYPTYARVTGAGWMLGIGRIGSILGPLIGGAILSTALPAAYLFYFAAIPMICVFCTAVFLILKAERFAPSRVLFDVGPTPAPSRQAAE